MIHGDEVDQANDLMEREIAARLSAVRAQAAIKPVYTGKCRFCEDEVPEPLTFCPESDCRDLYQREQEARKRNGYR